MLPPERSYTSALPSVSAVTSDSLVSKNACVPSSEIFPKTASTWAEVEAGPVETRVGAPAFALS